MEASFATARLPPTLTPYVRELRGARLRGGTPARALELPVAGTVVILELRSAWRIGVDADAPLERFHAFAGGLTLAPAASAHDGSFELIEFVLSPAGTAAVLGVPAAALAHDVVALDALLGAEAERLAARLAVTDDWTVRFVITTAWLDERVRQASATLSPDVAWALERLDATAGCVAIGTLQAELGCSRRHLASRFAQTVGTTPKAYAQLVRFTGAAGRLRGGAAPADVAAACGYADQAHLTRHVRRFGGTTPAALRQVE